MYVIEARFKSVEAPLFSRMHANIDCTKVYVERCAVTPVMFGVFRQMLARLKLEKNCKNDGRWIEKAGDPLDRILLFFSKTVFDVLCYCCGCCEKIEDGWYRCDSTKFRKRSKRGCAQRRVELFIWILIVCIIEHVNVSIIPLLTCSTVIATIIVPMVV